MQLNLTATTKTDIQTDINPNFKGWPKTSAETDAAVLSLSWSQRLLRGQGTVLILIVLLDYKIVIK